VETTEVRVGAPDGELFSRSGPSGSSTTGPWVIDGLTFFLQDTTDGQQLIPEHTLDQIAVHFGPAESLGPEDKVLFDEKRRLQALGRYERTVTTLYNSPFHLLDSFSFLQMHEEIIEQAIYYFPCRNERPNIVDGGANIGVSVCFFKHMYPDASIVAFEPDIQAFELLQHNTEIRRFQDVVLINAALSAIDDEAKFKPEGSYAGRIAHEDEDGTTIVPTTRLRPFLNRKVDLLKLNIEGAETEVIQDCSDLLAAVDRIVLEYHSFADEPQKLHLLLHTLTDAGFRVYVRSVACQWPLQPFVTIPVRMAMDLQLYVYAFRENARVA
jgi:FkbM family methyltransferase